MIVRCQDSCGVGLCVQLKSKASRSIVVDANEMLVRMTHRGACGCEENTGDGASVGHAHEHLIGIHNDGSRGLALELHAQPNAA